MPTEEKGQPSRGRRDLLRRLLSLAWPERRLLAKGAVFLVLATALGLVYPQALRVIVDEALAGRTSAQIDRLALLLFAVFLVQGAAIALRYGCFNVAGERTVARLRKDLYQRVLAQEIAFFDGTRTGELLSRLGSDTGLLQQAVGASISQAVRQAAGVIGGVGFLFYTSPRLTLVMLLVVPPVALSAVAFGRRVRRLSTELQAALAGASEVAEETLSSMRTVRAFAAEAREAGRYGAAVDSAFASGRRVVLNSAAFLGGASVAAFSAAVAVLWYGGHLLLEGRITAGALGSFFIYTMLVAVSLGSLGELWAELMRASGAASRIFELMDRLPQMPLSGGAVPATARGDIQFDAVCFSYPSRPHVLVLDSLELTLAEGEHVALVGPSGGGKSTVAALLSRLYDPDSGTVRFDGRDVRELDPGFLRAQVGSVAQEPTLFACSIADNIRYGRAGASDAEVARAASEANAALFISRFPDGYQTLVGERGVQLSGGQKQRIAIARALLKDPRVLVLDEATSALDSETEHLVREALERLMRGRTTLVIAHRLSTVIGADRVLVLEGGRLVQQGSHAALMAEEGLYRRLVERQFAA